MSSLEIATRVVIRLARNPHVQALSKHALRLATAQLIRAVRNHGRASRMKSL